MDEDEVDKRVREIAHQRQAATREAAALAARTAERMAALATAPAELLDEIAAAVAEKTAYPIFIDGDHIECEIAEAVGTRRQALFFVDAYGHPEDINAPTWEIVFNCQAWDRAEGELLEVFGWSHDRAVGFGIDAVLDGLAVLVHEGYSVVGTMGGPPEDPPNSVDELGDRNGLELEPPDTRPSTVGEGFHRVITSGWTWLATAYAVALYLAYTSLPKTG